MSRPAAPACVSRVPKVDPGIIAVGLILLLPLHAAAASPIGPKRQAELIHLLRHDCGSCHGMTLKGGLGPPLLPEMMRARTAAWLRRVILDGVPGTPMPPWRGLLSADEVDWLVNVLQQGVPDE